MGWSLSYILITKGNEKICLTMKEGSKPPKDSIHTYRRMHGRKSLQSNVTYTNARSWCWKDKFLRKTDYFRSKSKHAYDCHIECVHAQKFTNEMMFQDAITTTTTYIYERAFVNYRRRICMIGPNRKLVYENEHSYIYGILLCITRLVEITEQISRGVYERAFVNYHPSECTA